MVRVTAALTAAAPPTPVVDPAMKPWVYAFASPRTRNSRVIRGSFSRFGSVSIISPKICSETSRTRLTFGPRKVLGLMLRRLEGSSLVAALLPRRCRRRSCPPDVEGLRVQLSTGFVVPSSSARSSCCSGSRTPSAMSTNGRLQCRQVSGFGSPTFVGLNPRQSEKAHAHALIPKSRERELLRNLPLACRWRT